MENREIRKTFSSNSERPSYGLPKPRAGTVGGPRGSVRALVEMYETKIRESSLPPENEPNRNSSVGKLADDKLRPYLNEFSPEDSKKRPMRSTVGPRSTDEFLDFLDSDRGNAKEVKETFEDGEEASIGNAREEGKKEVREFREDSYKNHKEAAMQKAREIQENKLAERLKDRKDMESYGNSEEDREKGRRDSETQGDLKSGSNGEKREEKCEDQDYPGRGRTYNKNQEKVSREVPGNYFKSKPTNEVKLAEKISLKKSDLMYERGNEDSSNPEISLDTNLSTPQLQEVKTIPVYNSKEDSANIEPVPSHYQKNSELKKLGLFIVKEESLDDQISLQSARLNCMETDPDTEIVAEGDGKITKSPERVGLGKNKPGSSVRVDAADTVKETYKEEIKLKQENGPVEKSSPPRYIKIKKSSMQTLEVVSEEKIPNYSSKSSKTQDFAIEKSSNGKSSVESFMIGDKEDLLSDLTLEAKSSAKLIKSEEKKEINIDPHIEKGSLNSIIARSKAHGPEKPKSLSDRLGTSNSREEQKFSKDSTKPSNNPLLESKPPPSPPSLKSTANPPHKLNLSQDKPSLLEVLSKPPASTDKPQTILNLSSLSKDKSPSQFLNNPSLPNSSTSIPLKTPEDFKNLPLNNLSSIKQSLRLPLSSLSRDLPRNEDSLINEIDILCVNCYECIPPDEVDSHSRVCIKPMLDSVDQPQTDMKIRKMLKAISHRKQRSSTIKLRLYCDLEECSVAILETSMV